MPDPEVSPSGDAASTLADTITGGILKMLPWAKVTAPMIPVIAVIVLTGKWLMDLYKFNVLNGLYGAEGVFPDSLAFWTYEWSTIVTVVVYLGLSVYHTAKNVTVIK